MLRLAALLALGLAPALSAQSTPCLAAGDNLTFDDNISMGGPNLLLGIRETTGNAPLTVHAIEMGAGGGPWHGHLVDVETPENDHFRRS